MARKRNSKPRRPTRKNGEHETHEHGRAVFSKTFPKTYVYANVPGMKELREAIFDGPGPDPTKVYQPPSRKEVDKIVSGVLKRLPRYLRAAGKAHRISKEQREQAHATIADFIETWYRTPSFDGAKILEGTEFAKLKTHRLGDQFFLTQAGRILYATPSYDTPSSKCASCPTEHQREENARALGFALDFMLEIFGFVFSLLGLAVPTPDDDAVRGIANILRAMFRQNWFKRVWRDLLGAFKSGNAEDQGKAILRFMEALEQSGNAGEIYAHLMAGLHWYDYLITIAKIIAWIVAAVSTGGAAIAAKVISIGLDILGLVVKVIEVTGEPEPAH